jgi:hypothetical protein
MAAITLPVDGSLPESQTSSPQHPHPCVTNPASYNADMKTQQLPTDEHAVLNRLLDPISRRLTPAAARALVELRMDPADQERVAELAEKCNDGELTTKERAEYAAYVKAGDIISILQSKARRFLKNLKP